MQAFARYVTRLIAIVMLVASLVTGHEVWEIATQAKSDHAVAIKVKKRTHYLLRATSTGRTTYSGTVAFINDAGMIKFVELDDASFNPRWEGQVVPIYYRLVGGDYEVTIQSFIYFWLKPVFHFFLACFVWFASYLFVAPRGAASADPLRQFE